MRPEERIEKIHLASISGGHIGILRECPAGLNPAGHSILLIQDDYRKITF
jgi:hypothetical protein